MIGAIAGDIIGSIYEGIKGAQATALAVFLARTGHGKEEIRSRPKSGKFCPRIFYRS